jgi:hypothetical protein
VSVLTKRSVSAQTAI